MSDLFKANFDKLLLSFLFLVIIAVVVYSTRVGDKELVLWARELGGTIIGSLVTLITGHILSARASAQGNGNASVQEK